MFMDATVIGHTLVQTVLFDFVPRVMIQKQPHKHIDPFELQRQTGKKKMRKEVVERRKKKKRVARSGVFCVVFGCCLLNLLLFIVVDVDVCCVGLLFWF